VVSHPEHASDLGYLAGPLAFHTVCMAVGSFLVWRAAELKRTRKAA